MRKQTEKPWFGDRTYAPPVDNIGSTLDLATWIKQTLEGDLADLVKAEVQRQSLQSLNSPEKVKLIAPAILSKVNCHFFPCLLNYEKPQKLHHKILLSNHYIVNSSTIIDFFRFYNRNNSTRL